MSARVSISITGITELRQRLTPEAFRMTLIDALWEALRPAAAAASVLAPRKTGKLAGSIRPSVRTRGGALSAAIVAGVRYGHLVEYGHRQVVGGRATPLRSTRRYPRRGNYSGHVVGQVPPHPFAGPAFIAQEGQISATLERRLAAAITGP